MSEEVPALWIEKVGRLTSVALGVTVATGRVSSLLRKRDLGSLWALDPKASPPRSVQRRLLGTLHVPPRAQNNGPESDATNTAAGAGLLETTQRPARVLDEEDAAATSMVAASRKCDASHQRRRSDE